jgi:methanethiol S-methyltransferase
VLTAAYGTAAYVLFCLVFWCMIGFVTDANFMVSGVHIVGKSIDRGGVGDGTPSPTTCGGSTPSPGGRC